MDELFGIGKKKKASKSSVIKFDGKRYVFDTGASFEKSSATIEQLQAYDWKSGNLSWLYQSSFHASYIDINLTDDKVYNFLGNWMDGTFKGGEFRGVFMGGKFEGKVFAGAYQQWQASPYSFVSGTVSDFMQGILGVKKLNATVFDASSPEKRASLLQIPVGWYVNLTDANGNSHSFKVLKTLDSADSNFILQSMTGSRNKVTIPWSTLRGSNESDFLNITTIEAGRKLLIPDVFAGDPLGTVSAFEVSPKGSAVKAHAQPKVYKFDLSLLAPLPFTAGKRKPLVTLKFDTDDEVNAYAKMLDEIKKGWFAFHMKRLVNALKFDIIDGYGKNMYLQDIFGLQKGSKKAPKDVQESLDWLENFVRIFIMNMVAARKKGGRYVDSPALQLKVLNPIATQIQRYIPEYVPPAPAPAPKGSGKKGGKGGKTPIFTEMISERVRKKMF